MIRHRFKILHRSITPSDLHTSAPNKQISHPPLNHPSIITMSPHVTDNSNSNSNSPSSCMTVQKMNQLKMPFPWKLHQMLEEAEAPFGGFHNIVSWLPDGKAFKIYDEEAFVNTVMVNFFNQSKIKSFTRQLYIYGFLKIPSGPNELAFYHSEFIRDDKQSCFSLRRNQAGDRRSSSRRGSITSTPGAAGRRGSTSSVSTASSYESYGDHSTTSSAGVVVTSPSPSSTNKHATLNITQIKTLRRNSLSDYVAGRPTAATNTSMRRSSMSNLPPTPSSGSRLFSNSTISDSSSSATPTMMMMMMNTTEPAWCSSSGDTTSKRHNSLSEFFDHALNLLPSGDAYASLPCLDSLQRQQSGCSLSMMMDSTNNNSNNNNNDLSLLRATSIGIFDKREVLWGGSGQQQQQDHDAGGSTMLTPNAVFSNNTNNGMEQQGMTSRATRMPQMIPPPTGGGAASGAVHGVITKQHEHHHQQQQYHQQQYQHQQYHQQQQHPQQYHQQQQHPQQYHHQQQNHQPPPPLAEIQMNTTTTTSTTTAVDDNNDEDDFDRLLQWSTLDGGNDTIYADADEDDDAISFGANTADTTTTTTTNGADGDADNPALQQGFAPPILY